ncbi:nuclear transport factor 2 family protein [Paracoccus homiensis]|uniref:SnoaL-like domain-containing protein n=1 Tax=Paracoccus homiensis TaxID=364199 RepID=A0A1I0IBF8_9RHOB|nr:nuclear transport factor 2 family protein [Paracoccus homiensis]SET93959.1 hypothetical protein SAMN04489858_11550 [Paracoccus homiensis]
MQRRHLMQATIGGTLAMMLAQKAAAQDSDAQTQASLQTVMAFMGAMGSGDSETVGNLMADDMVWQNEGDATLPWIGTWDGKARVFQFMDLFGQNFQTTAWQNEDAFAKGDTVAVFGRMNGITTHSGAEIGEFSFALRAKTRDGKVVLWQWFEDSFAVSKAYHNG